MRKNSFILIFFVSVCIILKINPLVFGQNLISGKVMLENGKPLKDVTVIVDENRPVITNTAGIFGVDIKASKPTNVKATKKNFKLKNWEFDNEEKKLRVLMEPLTNITGVLRDSEKKPIADARIVLSKINANKPALTNKKGEFNITIPEGVDASQPGEVYINDTQVPSENFSLDGGNIEISMPSKNSNLQISNSMILEKAKILDTKKINQIRVMNLTGSPLQMQKIFVNGKEYLTDVRGEVKVKEAIHIDTKIFIEGFKIKVLPTDFYLLINAEPLKNDEEIDTTKAINDIIQESATINSTGDYKEKFDQLIEDLEVQKQMLLQLNEQTRFEIEEITRRLNEDTNLSPKEKAELGDRLIELEQYLVNNELAYQEAVQKTKVALDSMRNVLQISEAKDRAIQQKIKEQEAEARRNLIIFGVIAISLVIIAITFFITNRRVKREHDEAEKAKDNLAIALGKVTQQKTEIEQKNTQITTSIRYAETMQKAILPLDETFTEHFDEFLKVYIPKDIVSGDFYWLLPLEHATFLALVDCTGHGVPGAFMSLIGNNSLNEIVNQKNIYSPAQILEELNNSIRKALRQAHTDNDDGMDVALCAISKPDQDGQIKVTFAGAKRNMIYYNQNESKELLEIKGDKKTVGGFFKENRTTQFTNQEVILQKGDIIYLFTDGLTDQTNPQQEKLGSVKLKELLKENLHLSLDQQQTTILQELNLHRQDADQRDDMTLIGIKL